jgi:hypothetical protein
MSMATKQNTRSLTSVPDQPGQTGAQFLGDEPGESVGPEPETIVGQPMEKHPATRALVEWLAQKCELDSEDDGAGMEAIVRQTLESSDMVAVLRQTLPQSGQDFVDTPMRLDAFRIQPSEYEDGGGAPYYASMSVVVGEPPEPRVINCGGWRILAQLARLADLDALPVIVMIIEAAKAKGKKNPPLMLVQVAEDGQPVTG